MKARRARRLVLLALAALPVVCSAADAAYERLLRAPAVKHALQHLRDDDARTLEEQIAITQIPAPPFKEQARASDFAARLRAAGLDDVSIDTEGNVIGKRPGSSKGRGPLLVLSAHLDTVFPEGSDVSVKRAGERYSGLGIIDDSRGLAAILSVLRAMQAAKLRTVGDVWFVGTVGEEALGNLRGVKALFAAHPLIDGFISVDGVDGPDEVSAPGIVARATGSRRWEFTFTGPGGHSFGNFGNPSAVHALGRAVARIADLQTSADPKTTFNVGVISGGTGVTAIAAQAVMQVDLRSNDATELAAVEKELQDIVDEAVAAENSRWRSREVRVERKLVGDRPASVPLRAHPVADAAVGAHAALGLGEPTLEFASTDSNVPLGLGIPAVTLNGGGIGDKAHSPDEWYQHVNAWRGPQVILLTTLRLAGLAGTTQPVLSPRK
jgi:acetylornithine deacetylase/succinyl-diaminopimelate desuccinylase-like protein